jgi:IS1 family transposase
MQFALPSNLQTELLAYDPTLKVLAKQAKAKTTKKAKYPLGNIPHLIPHNVVRESDQQAAIDHINQQSAPDRYRVFTTPVDVATPQARLKVIAILYHYEQVWYAAWLPPKKEADQYVYGHAYAFKNTAAAAKTAPHHIWTSKDKCIEHEGARGVQTFTYSMNITKGDIESSEGSGWRAYQWQASNLHCQKGREILEHCVRPYEASLREDMPTWSDSRGLFDRMRCKNIFDAADMPPMMTKCLDIKQGLTVDNLLNAAIEFNKNPNFPSSTFCVLERIKHIISKPAIKKLLQAELDRCTLAYNNPNNTERKPITQGFRTFVHVIDSIDWINKLWPDCPLDYYQTYYKELRYIRLSQVRTSSISSNSNAFVSWLREHMPVASMFTMLRKQLEQQTLTGRDAEVGYPRLGFHELNDTFSMAIRILDYGNELTPPKRWRIDDFHDYVQAESWKIQNPNESLRQDLFPEPIRVTRNDQTWSFFQPVDTHQLAMWGQAVRNCVGSASHYADDIKKRKHFIVLCMIDGKPTFTIQLVVDMGLMSVKQIAGVGNQRLTEDQKEAYTEAFREVLQQREKQLQSA